MTLTVYVTASERSERGGLRQGRAWENLFCPFNQKLNHRPLSEWLDVV